MTRDRPIFRSATTPAERPMDSRTVEAAQAEPAIRLALRDGGTCSLEAEGRRRELVHDPEVDAPLRGWPWPFTLFAPHRVRLNIYEGTMRSGSLSYEKKRIDEAIKYFLGGVPPKTKVIISRRRFGGGRS